MAVLGLYIREPSRISYTESPLPLTPRRLLSPSFVGKGNGFSVRAGSGWISSSFFSSVSGVTETDCSCSTCAAGAGMCSSRMSSRMFSSRISSIWFAMKSKNDNWRGS